MKSVLVGASGSKYHVLMTSRSTGKQKTLCGAENKYSSRSGITKVGLVNIGDHEITCEHCLAILAKRETD